MKNCLLSAAASGAFWLILLFVVCFLAVHTVRLAKIGWKYQKHRDGTSPEQAPAEKRGQPEPARREPTPKETPAAPAEKAPEPVYYIVERKRRRPRETYTPPKEIKFK